MSMQDPIADMLTRIRNGQRAKHVEVALESSKIKELIATVLKNEGYISDFFVKEQENNSKAMTIVLKYFQGQPVIEKITRSSKPGLRIYKSAKKLPDVPGFGVAVVSTSKGVMTHLQARSSGLGGEVLCEVA